MREPVRVRVGDAHTPRVIGPLTQTDIVRFAGAGGDFNPLHHDPEFVRSTGFPGVISMGQLPAGALAGWVSDWLGVEHLRELDIRFAAPVFLGDVLRLAGLVTAIEESDGTSIATVEIVVTRGPDTVVKGIAGAVVAVADPNVVVRRGR